MKSLLQSTLNTRALPTGDLRYIRSDFPGNLSDEEVQWLVENNITTIVDLREEKEYKGKNDEYQYKTVSNTDRYQSRVEFSDGYI